MEGLRAWYFTSAAASWGSFQQDCSLSIVMMMAHDLDDRQVVQINAPCPDTWKRFSQSALQVLKERALPRTTITAILYGNGRIKLKASSSGSTAGSPSMLQT